jgi:ribosomal-protein-alanine N-acetyltransferase
MGSTRAGALLHIDIRGARRADAAAIADIEALCFSAPWSFGDILREIEENDLARYIVGTADSHVISYAGLWVVPDEAYITNVAVHPDFRGLGIGAATVNALIERTRSAFGVTDFTLEVRASNAAAIRLYGNAGFREEGRRKAYYSDPTEDAVIMWLRNGGRATNER